MTDKKLKKSLQPHSSIAEIEKIQDAAIELGKSLGEAPIKKFATIDIEGNLLPTSLVSKTEEAPDDDDKQMDVKTIIDESFDGDKGILEIFKGVYKHAKKGSVPHATFIMNWYFKDGEGEEGIKEFRILEEIVE